MKRRALLRGLAAAPVTLAAAAAARAADYASAGEVFPAIDALEAEVGRRLRALSEAMPAARPLARSLLRDHERQRADREKLRARLGLPPGGPIRAQASDLLSLRALRGSQEALVHAHAEGLPAIGDPIAVDRLARHMVELSRHLAVIDLWIDAQESGG
jgi:hypothetical protein